MEIVNDLMKDARTMVDIKDKDDYTPLIFAAQVSTYFFTKMPKNYLG